MDDRVGARAHGDLLIYRSLSNNRIANRFMFAWRDQQAAQLVEFAVSLPLLVVFVVGIFDFSGAFTLKQKFTNVARDAARAAAADPASDLSAARPVSVIDAFQIVDQYLIANHFNDCGIRLTGSPTNLTWTSSATGNGCPPGGLTIIINRGYYFPLTAGVLPLTTCASPTVTAVQTAIVGTCVSIRYAYPWRFGRVASLLGRNTTMPNIISGVAVVMNEN